MTPGCELAVVVGAGEEHSREAQAVREQDKVRCGQRGVSRRVGADGVGAEVMGYTGPCRQRARDLHKPSENWLCQLQLNISLPTSQQSEPASYESKTASVTTERAPPQTRPSVDGLNSAIHSSNPIQEQPNTPTHSHPNMFVQGLEHGNKKAHTPNTQTR